MSTSQSQSRLNKVIYYPAAQWCNISWNSILPTFLPTSGGNHSNKQPNNLRDQDLDTYHSLTFRLPTWSVPTAVSDADSEHVKVASWHVSTADWSLSSEYIYSVFWLLYGVEEN